ncbi:MAG: DUF2089 domain-containing protein [Acidimicrobiales bacterium]
MSAGFHYHAAPRVCPVCGDTLALTRLGCRSCGTELSGSFEACEYCSLGHDDREMLAMFLLSRGNMKDLERHLGVSYPTARARFEALLGRLGLAGEGSVGGPEPEMSDDAPPEAAAEAAFGEVEILARLARGEIDVDTADRLLAGTTGGDETW